jgi:hypothetical protein
MLPKPDIHTIQANNTTRHNQTLTILVLLNAVLLTGVFTATLPTTKVFADSRLFKQDTKQNANCDTVGADSTLSDSCNQRATNNINNGLPRSTATSGILRIVCGSVIKGLACPAPIRIIGNNPQESTILCLICTIDITIGPGLFTVIADNTLGVTISFSGDCRSQTAPGSQEATGAIAAGQLLTCNINA